MEISKNKTIESLARKCPNRMGRTALMKFMFFLQELRGVPLGYHFTLYSYGPFDSDVLSDLTEAEIMGYVQSEVVQYGNGYGYEITPTEPETTSEIETDIDWIIRNFGDLNSSELELASTIVFADREQLPKKQTRKELIERVSQVKPHFSKERIKAQVDDLFAKNILKSVS